MSRKARVAAAILAVSALLGTPAGLAAAPVVTASVTQDTWNGPGNTTWT